MDILFSNALKKPMLEGQKKRPGWKPGQIGYSPLDCLSLVGCTSPEPTSVCQLVQRYKNKFTIQVVTKIFFTYLCALLGNKHKDLIIYNKNDWFDYVKRRQIRKQVR